MIAERPSAAVLEEWVRRSWDHRPPFTYEALVEMWHDEQRSRAKARETDWRSQQLDELGRRVAALERILGPHGKRLTDDLVAGIGEALGKIRVQDRERILGEVERRGYCTYRGVWSPEATYPIGSLVTCKGAAWAALGDVPKGVRPGSDPAWQLAVKSGEAGKGTVAA
jgi:hypothetical protein